MTSFYLGLALALALTLNAPWAIIRAAGTLLAATALAFLAWSIVLANGDGTFAAAPAGSWTPLLLNIEAAVIATGVALLIWASWRQFRRPVDPVPWRGTPAAYGQLTRGLHWASAALIIPAFAMGQYVAIMARANPARAEFLAVHMAIGGAVFLLLFGRMIERLLRPSPPKPGYVHVAHFALYAWITATCVSGLALASAPIDLMGFKLPNLPANPLATPMHRAWLPPLFALLFVPHLAGAWRAIRRMAR